MTDQERIKEIETLYRSAFRDFGPRALWNMRPADELTSGDALAITQALRTHGGMNGRRLADVSVLHRQIRCILEDAETFIHRMPSDAPLRQDRCRFPSEILC
jgi:hypothetical protein